MLTKEMTCYICCYCGVKFDNADECLRHENMHVEGFKSEKTLFDKFLAELNDISVKTNVRPVTTVPETISVVKLVPKEDGSVDAEGNPIMEEKEVSEVVAKEVLGDLPAIYCSKCMKPIAENHQYVSAFGYTICLDCMIPVLKSFAKNYGNFKSQFLTYMNMVNPHFSRFDVDEDGNIIEDRSKSMIIHKCHNHVNVPCHSNDVNSVYGDCECQHVH